MPPARVPGRRVERDEIAVPRTDVHRSLPDRGGRVDIRARALRPEQPAGGGAVRVDVAVRVPDVDAAVRDRRRRVEVLPVAEALERRRPPAQLARAGVQRVEMAAVRGHVDRSACIGGSGDDAVVRAVAPPHLPRPRVERVHVPVPRAEVEDPVDLERRGLDRPRPEAPQLASRARVHRDQEAACAGLVLRARQRVHQRLVDDALPDGRRRRGAAAEVLGPAVLAGLRVDGEEAALLLRDEDGAVRDRGRELEVVARAQRPQAPERRPVRERGGDVRALEVEPVRRPRLGQVARGRLRLRLALVGLRRGRRRRDRRDVGRIVGGDELLGRGAAHLAVARLVPVERERGAGDRDGEQGKADEKVAPHHTSQRSEGHVC